MLSYITLHPEGWQSHSYVACCGTSVQPVLKLLERQPQINTVLLCLDNDEAGHLPVGAWRNSWQRGTRWKGSFPHTRIGMMI